MQSKQEQELKGYLKFKYHTTDFGIAKQVISKEVDRLKKFEDHKFDNQIKTLIYDLMKIDKLIADAYVNRGAVESPEGLIGMSRYGCMVYMSNNLVEANTSYHNGAMLQREAIGIIIQRDNLARLVDWPQKHTKYVEVEALFGAAILRPTAGCRLNTRS